MKTRIPWPLTLAFLSTLSSCLATGFFQGTRSTRLRHLIRNGLSLLRNLDRSLIPVFTMIAAVALLIPHQARAQISDNWSTVDGGGGSSAGGQLELSGTAGQADAGNMSGGGYILYGGFWGMAAGWPPRLTITYANGFVTICWPLISLGYVLEQTDSLANPSWGQVGPGPTQTDAVTQCVTLQTGPTPKFYRLRKP